MSRPADFFGLARRLRRALTRGCHMALSTTTQAAIDAAVSAKGVSDGADTDLATAQGVLAQATQAVTDKTSADVAAHQDATAKAHTAINALLTDLGQPTAF